MTALADAPLPALKRAWLAPAAALLGAGWGSNQFTPMLVLYRGEDGYGSATLQGLFAAYAVGLIPGLLVGGRTSDAHGRRPVVLVAAVTGVLASGALIAGAAGGVPLLLAGRLLAGISSGAAFAAATVWVRELSLADDAADPGRAARRATVAMTTGFALGPFIAGALAQWAPDAQVLPYVPHVLLMVLVAVAVRAVPDTVPVGRARPPLRTLAGLHSARFRSVVLPLAPWVFAAPAVAFALLPAVVDASRSAAGVVVTGTITFLCALAGVLVQPLARRLGAGTQANPAASVGLALLAGGLVLAAFTAQQGEVWLLAPCALVLGAAYGLCMVGGLADVQRLADAESMAGMTAVYYAFTYLGFVVPYLAALAAHVVSYPVILAVGAVAAALTAVQVTWRAREDATW